MCLYLAWHGSEAKYRLGGADLRQIQASLAEPLIHSSFDGLTDIRPPGFQGFSEQGFLFLNSLHIP